MQEAQYDFLHGQTDRSDFFSPAMQQLCGIMKDNQVMDALVVANNTIKRHWRRIFPLYFTVPQYRDVYLRCNVLQGHSIAGASV